MKEKTNIKGQLAAYLQWPLYLSLVLVLATVAVTMIDRAAGVVLALFDIVYIAAALTIYFYRDRWIKAGLVEYGAEHAWIQKQLMTELGIPYALADEDGKLLWLNQEFQSLLKKEGIVKKQLTALFPEITRELLEATEQEISVYTTFGEKNFRVDMKPIFIENENLGTELKTPEASSERFMFAVSLFDETELLHYKKEIDNQKMVVGLIYLDNYEEALESVEEVRRSLLTALIDRKINKYISAISGVVKKMEKDKYFFAIKQQYVENLREERFSILEDVKSVNIGNEMAVTLSIGIGMNGDTYSQNYDFARTSIDMALGRGGDQAVLKDGSKIEYFGGKSQQAEKATRVKARVKAHAMRELMETKDRMLIMGHQMGDIDSLGASIGIYRIACSLNKKAHVVINQVTSSLRPMMERFVENPDYPEDLFLTGEQAAELVDANTMLVVVDVNRPSITDAPELLRMVKTIVVLDHHRQSSEIIDNATLSYVEPYASSACEMVAEVLQYISDDIRLKSLEADAMYAGIVIDTHNFSNQTGVRTFEAAAYLRRNGADMTRVRKLFRENMQDYKAKAQAIKDAEIYKESFAISVCPAAGIESPTIIGAQAANELLDIIGIKASAVFTEYQGTIYVSARSIDEVNVQVMMEQLGGGGHRTIAGAQLKDVTVEEAKERLKEVIDKMLEKGDIN